MIPGRRSLTLGPLHSLAGELALPGSKSISNRMLLLAALAKGRTRVRNLLRSEDTAHMLNALRKLGIGMAEDGRDWLVEGAAGALATDGRKVALHLGLAGTALRPLTAALALGRGEFLLDGVPRMRERPIAPLVDALRRLGADIEYAGTVGYPPIRVRGTGLRGGEVEIDGSLSSQFLSSLLLAAPLAAGPVRIRVRSQLVSRPYIDLSLDLMRRFGVPVAVEEEQRMFSVPSHRLSLAGPLPCGGRRIFGHLLSGRRRGARQGHSRPRHRRRQHSGAIWLSRRCCGRWALRCKSARTASKPPRGRNH